MIEVKNISLDSFFKVQEAKVWFVYSLLEHLLCKCLCKLMDIYFCKWKCCSHVNGPDEGIVSLKFHEKNWHHMNHEVMSALSVFEVKLTQNLRVGWWIFWNHRAISKFSMKENAVSLMYVRMMHYSTLAWEKLFQLKQLSWPSEASE